MFCEEELIWLCEIEFFIVFYVVGAVNVFESRSVVGARGGAVGWGTALQTESLRDRFPIVSLEFFIDIILPVALWLWGRLNL
jgi:hypothetical protein